METLYHIWIVLPLVFVPLATLGQGLTVNIKPDEKKFYTEISRTPIVNITCKSDCQASWNCTYKWYSIDRNLNRLKPFTVGQTLFRNKTIEKNTIFVCLVQSTADPKIQNYSSRIEVIVKGSKEPPTQDGDVEIDSFGKNSYSASTKRVYGPSHVSINYTTDPEGLWEDGGNVTITCSANCHPRCDQYQIYRNEQVLSSTNWIHFQKERTQSGKYKCAAYDVRSKRYVNSTDVSIDIKYGPSNVFIHYSSDPEGLWEGKGNVTITCSADCHPRCDQYRIYHDEQILSNRKRTHIKKVRENSGKYRCAAYNVRSKRYVYSTDVTIDIKYGPSNVSIHYTNDSRGLWEGNGHVTLTCSADCHPTCDRFRIYYNGEILNDTKRTVIKKNRKNSGKYRCAAFDVRSNRYINSTDVAIDFKYKIIALSSKEKEISLMVNNSLPSDVICTIQCNVECDSEITVTKNSTAYKTIELNQNIFSERKAIPSDSGIYRCISGNFQSADDFKLHILYGPRNITITNSEGSINSEIVLMENSAETYRLTCLFECNPRCRISWYKDGRILNKEKRQDIDIRVNRHHSGTYRCEAEGVEGNRFSDGVTIIVHYPPRNVEIKPRNYTFYTRRNGTPVTDITCKADCLPQCTYKWYGKWKIWPFFESTFSEGSSLFANRNFTNYYSRFRCAAKNSIRMEYSGWITVEVKDGPADVKINAKGSEIENQAFELQCSASCYHGCLSYTWFHKEHMVRGIPNLTFNNLSRTDNGEYICKVKDYFGTATQNYIVNSKNGPSDVRIQYTTSDGNLKENIYGEVNIICEADCNPACSYKFYRNGQYLRYGVRGNRKRIWKSKVYSGQYSCSAENSVNGRIHSSNSVDILIKYKPKLSRFGMMPRDITAPGYINFTFNVDSLPPSNVTMVHSGSGKILNYDTNVKGFKSYQIEVTSCLDEGEYKLIAKNNIGSADDQSRIRVKCSPLILKYSNVSNKGFKVGDKMNLTATFIANPTASASWSFVSYKSRNGSQKVEKNLIQNGKTFTSIIVDDIDVDDFGIYQLTLVNNVGNETKTFSIRGPPQPPTELTLDCPSTAFIVWKPGFDGGINQSFLIEYTTNLSSPWLSRPLLSLTSEDNDRLSTYMSSMNLNIRYYFRVVSENEFGRVISDKIVNCTVLAFENEEERYLNVQTIAGISGVTVLFLVAVIVLVILGMKRCQIQNKKGLEARTANATQEDCGMGMIENTLYISSDEVNATTMLPSNAPQNNAHNTASGNDVYSVVKKTMKIESNTPVYAEVCKSPPAKDKPAIKKKPTTKTKSIFERTINKDGLVYVEIDLKDMASNRKPVIHGSDNKTLYVDIDFNQHADPLPDCNEEDADDTNQKEKETQLK